MRALTVAVPSFLGDVLLPSIAAEADRPIRSVELPPSLLPERGLDRVFAVAITVGDAPLGSFRRECVGEVRHGLFGSPRLSAQLGETPTRTALSTVPFVGPLWFDALGGTTPGDDRCPLEDRTFGHRVPTIRLGAAIAARTDQLVYGPASAAVGLIEEGRLVEIGAAGISVHDPLFLASDPSVVTESEHSLLAQTIRRALRALPCSSGIIPAEPVAIARLASA